ncbi:MAG TPA: CDP-alcohol phosphatidyltransferase family protein [Methanosarcinales archaeon]|nr:CDP-alcohol phosphatidyltransferase family protein [Methanosarcinales archaeon]
MLSQSKDTIRSALKPIAKRIVGINPNTFTLLGLITGILSGVSFALHSRSGSIDQIDPVIAGGFFILVSGFFDVIDGAVAREKNRVTKFGGVLDSIYDRYGDAAIIVGAMYGGLTELPIPPHIPWFWGAIALIGSFMVSYTRTRAESAGVISGVISIGIAERAERMLIIAIGSFFGIVNWAIFIVAIIAHITVLQRIIVARKVLK